MNIVYFVTEDNYFLSHRLPIALNAQKKGHKITVITKVTDNENLIEGFGFSIVPLNFSRTKVNILNDFLVIFKLINVLKSISADIIHNVALKPIIIGSLASLFCKDIKVANAFTGMGFLFTSKLTLKYTILRFFVRRLLIRIVSLKRANSIVQNEGDRDFLISNFFANIDKISLIRGSGVNTSEYSPSAQSRKQNLKQIRVLTTCRMLKDKGVLDFYEAAIILHNRGVPCKCVFAGGIDRNNPSSVGIERLNSWIDDGIIEYLGHSENILNELYNCDIFILASYREGLSKSILEAASVGLPLISTDIAASKNIVIEGLNGFLVPINNAFDLANAIEKLVLSDELRIEFGNNSRDIVMKNFSEKIISKSTLDFYESLFN